MLYVDIKHSAIIKQFSTTVFRMFYILALGDIL